MVLQASVDLIFGKLDLIFNFNTTLLRDLRLIEKQPHKVVVCIFDRGKHECKRFASMRLDQE